MKQAGLRIQESVSIVSVCSIALHYLMRILSSDNKNIILVFVGYLSERC